MHSIGAETGNARRHDVETSNPQPLKVRFYGSDFFQGEFAGGSAVEGVRCHVDSIIENTERMRIMKVYRVTG